MPRLARWVLPGKLHHITRARHRPSTRFLLLPLAAEHVLVLASCLVPNHIHLIVVPPDEESLAIADLANRVLAASR